MPGGGSLSLCLYRRRKLPVIRLGPVLLFCAMSPMPASSYIFKPPICLWCAGRRRRGERRRGGEERKRWGGMQYCLVILFIPICHAYLCLWDYMRDILWLGGGGEGEEEVWCLGCVVVPLCASLVVGLYMAEGSCYMLCVAYHSFPYPNLSLCQRGGWRMGEDIYTSNSRETSLPGLHVLCASPGMYLPLYSCGYPKHSLLCLPYTLLYSLPVYTLMYGTSHHSII